MTGGCSRGDTVEDWELGALFWILVLGCFFFLFDFVLSIVDLQCCVSFCNSTVNQMYICIYVCVYICIHTHTNTYSFLGSLPI